MARKRRRAEQDEGQDEQGGAWSKLGSAILAFCKMGQAISTSDRAVILALFSCVDWRSGETDPRFTPSAATLAARAGLRPSQWYAVVGRLAKATPERPALVVALPRPGRPTGYRLIPPAAEQDERQGDEPAPDGNPGSHPDPGDEGQDGGEQDEPGDAAPTSETRPASAPEAAPAPAPAVPASQPRKASPKASGKASKASPKASGGGSRWTLASATAEAERRAKGGESWEGAAPAVLVGLYAYLHQAVLGASAAELETPRGWDSAVDAARVMLARDFAGDSAGMMDFVRWAWRRERAAEKKIAGTDETRRRLGPGLQFSSRLLGDYRADLARKGEPLPGRAARPVTPRKADQRAEQSAAARPSSRPSGAARSDSAPAGGEVKPARRLTGNQAREEVIRMSTEDMERDAMAEQRRSQAAPPKQAQLGGWGATVRRLPGEVLPGGARVPRPDGGREHGPRVRADRDGGGHGADDLDAGDDAEGAGGDGAGSGSGSGDPLHLLPLPFRRAVGAR